MVHPSWLTIHDDWVNSFSVDFYNKAPGYLIHVVILDDNRKYFTRKSVNERLKGFERPIFDDIFQHLV